VSAPAQAWADGAGSPSRPATASPAQPPLSHVETLRRAFLDSYKTREALAYVEALEANAEGAERARSIQATILFSARAVSLTEAVESAERFGRYAMGTERNSDEARARLSEVYTMARVFGGDELAASVRELTADLLEVRRVRKAQARGAR
jgi:hypothetical protein